MMNDFKTLRVNETDEGRVLRVQLDRPDKGNALSSRILSELLQVLNHLEDDRTIRVMVLSGAGEHFCQGGDRSEFMALIEEDPSGGALHAYGDKAVRVCEALERSKVMTIARLHGDVIGAGIGLAVFCDLRVGAANCRFRMPEVALGLPPAWGGILDRLQAEAGQASVRELLLTADQFDAERAKNMSILQKVVPLDDLDDSIVHWVKPALRRDPTAMRMTKDMLNARANAARLSAGSFYEPALLTGAYIRRQLARRR
ncbi:enoyl-CoA hydratase/isomerase family protein [Streptomyces sp. NPDC048045]|uniref:enoyl-CoA hydratase/isomerase family protein n=1 Tax=Streptomyces sp. NPDC048045 TaxID=3154710 RepID=UPI00343B4E69